MHILPISELLSIVRQRDSWHHGLWRVRSIGRDRQYLFRTFDLVPRRWLFRCLRHIFISSQAPVKWHRAVSLRLTVERGNWQHLSLVHRSVPGFCGRADSISWNPHKMLGIPLQCSMLLTRHVGLMKAAHGVAAPYLFQKDKFYDTALDTGDSSLQCGRKVCWDPGYFFRHVHWICATAFTSAQVFICSK